MTKRTPAHYPILTTDTIRYGDTDCQGHVNNAVFSTFIETGRSEILYRQQPPLCPEGTQFVIARLEIDYLREILWPGEIVCGTAVAKVGNSSVRLVQSLFCNGEEAAYAESVIVLTDKTSRQSCTISDEARERLLALGLRG
ncbi:acyl-CoA thioesterase [Uruburuella testudinis]|uniref:Acyl-CoA thioesterase n=1 Tax=Uruburuella testudinis TaxID=1282863 RepID=A0ABY4E0C8_9NEIS|nr:thioesterase family protein [Uruburuella testudinis]UOO82431.1 acyl-CoA thioesterase [Uruburuella testudinis]